MLKRIIVALALFFVPVMAWAQTVTVVCSVPAGGATCHPSNAVPIGNFLFVTLFDEGPISTPTVSDGANSYVQDTACVSNDSVTGSCTFRSKITSALTTGSTITVSPSTPFDVVMVSPLVAIDTSVGTTGSASGGGSATLSPSATTTATDFCIAHFAANQNSVTAINPNSNGWTQIETFTNDGRVYQDEYSVIPNSGSLAKAVVQFVPSAGVYWSGSLQCYTMNASPTISPVARTYGGTQSATLATTTPGSPSICYTTNGDIPTATTAGTCDSDSGNENTYSIPVSIASTATLKALTTVSGSLNSAVSSAAYTIVTAVKATQAGSGIIKGSGVVK